MKFAILKEKLKEGVTVVERIAAKSLNLPILNNILISVEKNFINLTATDLEIGINWWQLGKTETEGKLAVPTKVLSSFIGSLPNKPVNLKANNFSLNIDCENYATVLNGFNAEEFPLIPKLDNQEPLVLKSQTFCQALSQVADIAGSFSTKPEISGVFFQFQKNTIVMTATDSFRLGEKRIEFKAPLATLANECSFILPQRAAREIINIFGDKEGDLQIYFSPNQVMFEIMMTEAKHPHVQLVSRLIEGEYPNYQEIIPKKNETTAVIQKKDFISQLKTAAIFSGKANEVKIKINPEKNRIDISSQNADLGQHQSFLTGKIEGEACEVAFNHKFLLDGLLNLNQEQADAVLELNGSERPGILRSKGDESYLYLVMPIRA